MPEQSATHLPLTSRQIERVRSACNDHMDLLDYADNYFDFLDRLREILQRPVDLVIEKDLSNPVRIESINESKVLTYGREN